MSWLYCTCTCTCNMDLCTCDVLKYFEKYLNPCLFLIISEEQGYEKSNVSYLFCLHSHANRYCMFSKACSAHEDWRLISC